MGVAVRISGQTVDALSALAQLDQLIRDNPWIRGRLIFEITQSSRIADAGAANAGIQRLREQGIQVCLCDFATSAHGFQYLADLEVDVLDNGHGFDPAAVTRGNGLGHLRRRMEEAGGHCTVDSQPGAGTRVRLSVALPAAEDAS